MSGGYAMNWTMRTVVGSFVLLAAGHALAADVMETIKSRGTLIVGVKPDYKPFGFRDPNGTLIGIEPALVREVKAKASTGKIFFT